MRGHLTTLLRGIALALGLFAAINLIASWRSPGFDPNIWWIDLHELPDPLQDALLGITSLALLAWAIRPQMRPWRRYPTLGLLTIMLLQVIANAIVFYVLLAKGLITSSLPLPLSILVALLLLVIGWAMTASQASSSQRRPITVSLMAAGFVLFFGLFPLAQMLLYGKTDYRRKADAILVLGARTYANGTPSQALADRVRTGCTLYRAGLAPLLIMSGGPGDGTVHETQAMATLATKLGVPATAILRDEQGLNTQASIRQLDAIAHAQNLHRILAVSHYWHLPRIKLAVGRRDIRVFTVPAVETRPLSQTPFLICRETAAFWKYYLQLLVH